MKLKGLKALFLGDSITYGAGASSLDKNYVNLLAKYTGLNTVNYGVGGTRIARQTKASPNEVWDYDFNARARSMDKDADIMILDDNLNVRGVWAMGDHSIFSVCTEAWTKKTLVGKHE